MSPGAFRVLRFSVIGMGIAILVLATLFALQLWRVVREAGSAAGPAGTMREAGPRGPVLERLGPADLGLKPGTRILSVAAAGDGRVVLLIEEPGGDQLLLLVDAGAFNEHSNGE